MSGPEHKYKVAYHIEPLGEGKTKAELQADPELENYGGTDEFILISQILPEAGGRSVQWTSANGEGKPLDDTDIFGAVVLIMRSLALAGRLDPGREQLCWEVWNQQLRAMNLPRQTLEQARALFGRDPERIN